jgi:hypothetical protein
MKIRQVTDQRQRSLVQAKGVHSADFIGVLARLDTKSPLPVFPQSAELKYIFGRGS